MEDWNGGMVGRRTIIPPFQYSIIPTGAKLKFFYLWNRFWKRVMIDTIFKYDIGVIHGRFQVFHNDHLKYLLSGIKLCHHMVVGITNPDPSLVRQETADPNRSSLTANPLTYYERYILIHSVMQENNIDLRDLSVVPLPINRPELYKYYVPLDAVFFLSIYDDWGKKKLSYFESLGLKTHMVRKVPLEEKGISAGEIRNFMINNQPWEHLLPTSVARLMKQWKIPERLKKAKSKL